MNRGLYAVAGGASATAIAAAWANRFDGPRTKASNEYFSGNVDTGGCGLGRARSGDGASASAPWRVPSAPRAVRASTTRLTRRGSPAASPTTRVNRSRYRVVSQLLTYSVGTESSRTASDNPRARTSGNHMSKEPLGSSARAMSRARDQSTAASPGGAVVEAVFSTITFHRCGIARGSDWGRLVAAPGKRERR